MIRATQVRPLAVVAERRARTEDSGVCGRLCVVPDATRSFSPTSSSRGGRTASGARLDGRSTHSRSSETAMSVRRSRSPLAAGLVGCAFVAVTSVATPPANAQACWLVWITESGRTRTREVCEDALSARRRGLLGESLALPDPSPEDDEAAIAAIEALLRTGPTLRRELARFDADRSDTSVDTRSVERLFIEQAMSVRLRGPMPHVERGLPTLSYHVFGSYYETTDALELTIPVSHTPPELARYVAPPDAVARVVAAHPDATAVGWTER